LWRKASRSGSGKGRGRSTTALTMLKMAVAAAMQTPSVAIAARPSVFCRHNDRTPNRRSRNRLVVSSSYFFSTIFVAVIHIFPSFSATVPVTVAGFSPVQVWPNFSRTSFLAR
jgi:hypothetical protein